MINISEKEYRGLLDAMDYCKQTMTEANKIIGELKKSKLTVRAVIIRDVKSGMIRKLQVVEITNTPSGIVIEVIK